MPPALPLLPRAVTTPATAVASPLLRAGLRTGTAAVRVASLVRGERAIHGKGRTLTGRLEVTGGVSAGAALLDEPGSYDVLVRFSRSLGLPAALSDVLGLAVRILDAHGPDGHQDLLLDSTRPEPVLRRFPWIGRDPLGWTYCSLLPYEIGGRHLLLGARPRPEQPAASLDTLPDELELELLVATPHGRWESWAVLRTAGDLPAPLGEQTRFDPAVTGGGISPAGPFQEWRSRAYPASHVASDEL